jgi:hypothetical protein
MNKYAIILLTSIAALATPAFAGADELKFNPDRLCQWQAANNSMDAGECGKLEDEAKSKIAELEGGADGERKSACVTEAKNFAVDSGFASYTVYAGCLKDGPGSL